MSILDPTVFNPIGTQNLESSDFSKYFPGTAFGSNIDLPSYDSKGRLPRVIVMLEAGALKIKNSNGIDCSVPSLPQWHVHHFQAKTILAAQTASLLVMW